MEQPGSKKRLACSIGPGGEDAGTVDELREKLPEVLGDGDGKQGGPRQKQRRLLDSSSALVGNAHRSYHEQGKESSDRPLSEMAIDYSTEIRTLRGELQSLQGELADVVSQRESMSLECSEQFDDPAPLSDGELEEERLFRWLERPLTAPEEAMLLDELRLSAPCFSELSGIDCPRRCGQPGLH